MVFTIISLFFMAINCNTVTIVLFKLFQTISKQLKSLINSNSQFNLSNRSEIKKEYKTEYLLTCETWLFIGRIISSAIFILLAYFNPLIMISTYALFLILFATNSIKLQRVIKEDGVE